MLQVARPSRLAKIAHLKCEGLYDAHPLLETKRDSPQRFRQQGTAVSGLTLRALNLA